MSAFQALRIPVTHISHLLFKLFVSRLPASLICFSSSSYPDYPHPSSAFQALRIPITRISYLLFKNKNGDRGLRFLKLMYDFLCYEKRG
ncbi:hypothetical protein CWN84_05510 [Vibrio splendidus]|nr:hypothetical protein CWN84_05510 [Vibrio splendidus]